ncbi:hypothetical protein E9993_23135 [Labilibacter sediminis]|nr:hypothetical protein E9993_23135 [Labilibacter sediminis]
MNRYREQNERLVREVFDLENAVYNAKKPLRAALEKLEATQSDNKKLQEEHSVARVQLRVAKDQIAELSAELSALKAKYNDADFTFKKFDVSSVVVESMIEKHYQFKDQKTKGLGYSSVPPPFNGNFTPPLENLEIEQALQSQRQKNGRATSR